MLMDKEQHKVNTFVINAYLVLWKEREREKEMKGERKEGRKQKEGGRKINSKIQG